MIGDTYEVEYPNRLYWYKDGLNDGDGGYSDNLSIIPASKEDANLIGSKTINGKHAPLIDLDFPCHLIESSTPGHYHLYIDKEITWVRYLSILEALHNAGLLQHGVISNARKTQQTFLRVNEPKPMGPQKVTDHPLGF